MICRMKSVVVTHMVPVPDPIAEVYLREGQRKVIATLNGAQVRRYLFQASDGQYGIVIGKSVIRELGLRLEEPTIVELRPDPHPDQVAMCRELVTVLEQDQDASDRFHALTTGRRRSLAFFVNTARRSATRIRRALALAHDLKKGAGTPPAQ